MDLKVSVHVMIQWKPMCEILFCEGHFDSFKDATFHKDIMIGKMGLEYLERMWSQI